MSTTELHGTLESPRETDLSDHLVVGEYEVPIAPGASTWIPGRSSVAPARSGAFALGLPGEVARRGPISVTVFDPRGLPVGAAVVKPDDVDGPVTVEITVAAPTHVEPSDDPALGGRLRYAGRVLDPTGEGYPAGHQILFWSRSVGTDAPEPLSVALTRDGGYFSGPWVDGVFDSIDATVGPGDVIPVQLDDGRMPQHVLLVAAEPGPLDEADTCAACADASDVPHAVDPADLAADPATYAQDAGVCTSFSIPDRTVDEVTFTAVVRTTQPALKAQTTSEEAVVPRAVSRRLIETVLRRPRRPERAPSVPDQAPAPPGGYQPGGGIEPGGGYRPGGGFEPGVYQPSGLPSGAIDVAAQPIVAAAALEPQQVLGGALARANRYAPGLDLDSGRSSPTTVDHDALLRRRLVDGHELELGSSVLSEIATDPSDLTPRDLLRAEQRSVIRRLRRAFRLLARSFAGRFRLEPDAQIAWDEIPDAYQAMTVAHGHLLSFRQVWRSDGYSLGSPLYSLPLAPGQQKLVSILDWSRSEVASRRAERTETEYLVADLSHDSDVSETINSVLTEELTGSSRSWNWNQGTAVGAFIGPLVIGAAGGVSRSGSEAEQASSRSISGSALNLFRDHTQQAASAVRSQRSSVVQVGRQAESVRAQTEVIANYSHCHAMTVHYFEVLRHLQVTIELAAVRECLLVPLAMSEFTATKALRWERPLRRALRRRSLDGAFESLERVESDWADADVPDARYADEAITDIDGELWLTAYLPRPADDAADEFDSTAWAVYASHFGSTQDTWERYLGTALPEDRDEIWATRLAPTVLQSMVDDLYLYLQVSQPYPSSLWIGIDATVVGTYRPGEPTLVTFVATQPMGSSVVRADVDLLFFQMWSALLPTTGSIVIDSGTVRYRTAHLSTSFFDDRRIHNDISLGDDVVIPVTLSKLEKRNPKEIDQRRADELLLHLNEQPEYYHRAIWLTMDPNRRFMLLDGVLAPNAGGRSVASVVDNVVVGVVGNSLVMPVAPGVQLDSTYEFADTTPADLRHLYAADSPPPVRLSFPTAGVYAEAVLGACNSCEQIDDTRFWRFEDAPIPDRPTPIEDLSLASRRTESPSLAPDQFAAPVVGYQAVPETPAATGLAAAMEALGTADIFRDITGLAMNQENSAAGLEAALSSAQGFATKAAALAQQQFLAREVDRTMELISGMSDVSDEHKQAFTEALFRGALGQIVPGTESPADSELVKKGMEKMSSACKGSVTHTTPHGTASVTIGSSAGPTPIHVEITPMVVPIRQQTSPVSWAVGATMMENWRNNRSDPIEVVVDRLGPSWRTKYDHDLVVGAVELQSMAATLGMTQEPGTSYTPQGLAGLVAGHGAVLAIGDDAIADNGVSHVRILVALDGDGTTTGTDVTVADSATGTFHTMTFAAFEALHVTDDPMNSGVGFFHY